MIYSSALAAFFDVAEADFHLLYIPSAKADGNVVARMLIHPFSINQQHLH